MIIFSGFKSDERGSISIMFGLLLIAMALFAGMAVDISRGYNVSSFVSSALDSTALSTARELQRRDMTDEEIRAFAQRQYEALVAARGTPNITFDPITIAVDRENEILNVSAKGVLPTYFAGLAGTDTLTVNETATVNYEVRVVELAMVLDVTGSMSGSKIGALKTAATNLVEQIIPTTTRARSNRIALAPYASSVNLGSLADRVTAPGNDSQDGCVVGRDGFEAATDRDPGTGRWLTAVDPAAPLGDRDPTEGLQADAYSCPAAEVLTLSNSRTQLLSRVNDFSADGWTAGHLGAAWGWYLVSPEWASVFGSASAPSSYDDKRTVKAVLLMTDGIFNTRFVGPVDDTSDELARDICAGIKDKNVQVFAVAFEAPTAAEETLRDCATSGAHYFSAENADELNQAFTDIADSLTSLRLTN